MADLASRSASAGLDLPLLHSRATLAVPPDAPIFSLSPFRGKTPAVAAALGLSDLATGCVTDLLGGARLIWSGLDHWLLVGRTPPDLAGLAAVTDQTDGWTRLMLTGPDADAILARLTPLDLARTPFAARSLLGHIPCLIAANAGTYEIFLMRSFTRSAVHDIETAMRAVAARARIT